jgi:hypothetical protein
MKTLERQLRHSKYIKTTVIKFMNIDEIFKNFSERLTEINIYQRIAKETAQKELEQLNIYAEKIKNNTQLEAMSLSLDSMYFSDARTGELKLYGFRQSFIDDRTKIAVFRQNKQYCWLLAEAYEEFEDFLESVYAYIGYKDNNDWLLSDFGKVSFSELVDKDYNWYLSKVKEKDKIKHIISRFRVLHPELVEIEMNNKLNVNLRVAIELITNLRHIIVHKSGIVSDKDIFLKNVLENSGLYNNGKYNPVYKIFIERFFGEGEYKNIICLLEIKHPENPLAYYNLYRQLLGYLMAYATLIFENIKKSEAPHTLC